VLCCKQIDLRDVSDDLASPRELEIRKKLGYVAGAEIPSPSVISLNGMIASLAVTEFLALTTAFKPVRTYTSYDMLEQSVVNRLVKPDPKCIACSVRGLGDSANIERYAQMCPPWEYSTSVTQKVSKADS